MAEVKKHYNIPVVVWSVAHAEYLHPAHHTMQIRLTNNQWMVLDKWKDHEGFSAIVRFAEDSSNDFKVKEFGWREKEEELKFRRIAQEEMEKALAAKQRIEAAEKEAVEEAHKAPVEDVQVVSTAEPVSVEASTAVVVGTTPEVSVVEVNKESEVAATATIIVPAVVTPVMEVQVVNAVESPSAAALDPQVELKLVPVETVAENAGLTTIETPPEEAANVVIAVSPEVAAVAEAANLDIPTAVTEAIKIAEPALPEKSEEVQAVPTTPEVLPAPEAPQV